MFKSLLSSVLYISDVYLRVHRLDVLTFHWPFSKHVIRLDTTSSGIKTFIFEAHVYVIVHVSATVRLQPVDNVNEPFVICEGHKTSTK